MLASCALGSSPHCGISWSRSACRRGRISYAMNAACDQGAAGGVSDIAEQMRLTSGAALPDSGEVVSEIASGGV